MGEHVTEEQALAAKRRYSAQFRAVPGVCAVGVEKRAGQFVLAVHLDSEQPTPSEETIPKVVEGVRVIRHLGSQVLPL